MNFCIRIDSCLFFLIAILNDISPWYMHIIRAICVHLHILLLHKNIGEYSYIFRYNNVCLVQRKIRGDKTKTKIKRATQEKKKAKSMVIFIQWLLNRDEFNRLLNTIHSYIFFFEITNNNNKRTALLNDMPVIWHHNWINVGEVTKELSVNIL